MNDKFSFKKSLGQNFLIDKNIIHNIVDKADIDKNTLVIEIGPGGGALTKEIVPLCGKAILYEADVRLETFLKDLLCEYDNFSLIFGDFLKADLKVDLQDNIYDRVYVIANLPYYITTSIIMKFINDGVLPDKMVIMVQKEVADRFVASVGSRNYGSFTVFLNYYYDIVRLFDVSRNCFKPRPNVDSTVVEMKLKKNNYNVKDINLFRKIVRDSFAMKRKNLRNNLRNYDLNVIEKVLKRYGFFLTDRAEQLELNIFVDIANALFDCNVNNEND